MLAIDINTRFLDGRVVKRRAGAGRAQVAFELDPGVAAGIPRIERDLDGARKGVDAEDEDVERLLRLVGNPQFHVGLAPSESRTSDARSRARGKTSRATA